MRTAKTDALKSQSHIQIAGEELAIEWIEDTPFHVKVARIAEPLRSPPSQKSPEHILNRLTDDSLRTIFASNILSLDDLCSVGSVCSRFNAIATQVFAAKYGEEEKLLSSLQSDALWKIEEYFRIAPNASIDYLDFDRINAVPITGMIMKYCRNVKKLQWNCAHEQSIIDLLHNFDNLTHLILWYARHDFTGTFTSNASLEYLKVSGMTTDFKLPNIHLPKLVKLELCHARCAVEGMIEQFCRMNPQLKSLTIDTFGLVRVLPYLPNLEELRVIDPSDEIDLSRREWSSLTRLKHLKSINIHECSQVMSFLLRALIDEQMPLECLVLDNSEDIDYPLAEIQQLKAVKCLKIGHINGQILHELTGCFGNFAEVTLFTQYLQLEDIRDLLRKIDHSTKITIRLYNYVGIWIIHGASVADEIDEIRRVRNIDFKVIIEIGSSANYSDDTNLVGFNIFFEL